MLRVLSLATARAAVTPDTLEPPALARLDDVRGPGPPGICLGSCDINNNLCTDKSYSQTSNYKKINQEHYLEH